MTSHNIILICVCYVLVAALVFCIIQVCESISIRKSIREACDESEKCSYDKLSLDNKIYISLSWLMIALIYAAILLIMLLSIAFGCIAYPIHALVGYIGHKRRMKKIIYEKGNQDEDYTQRRD